MHRRQEDTVWWVYMYISMCVVLCIREGYIARPLCLFLGYKTSINLFTMYLPHTETDAYILYRMLFLCGNLLKARLKRSVARILYRVNIIGDLLGWIILDICKYDVRAFHVRNSFFIAV